MPPPLPVKEQQISTGYVGTLIAPLLPATCQYRPSGVPALVQSISAAQAGKQTRRHEYLHRLHIGLFLAPQPPLVVWVPLHLMSHDANHGQFRRLGGTLMESGRDTLQTLLASGDALDFCCGSIAMRTQRMAPNRGCRQWVWVWGGGNPSPPPHNSNPPNFLKNDKKKEKREKKKKNRRGREGGGERGGRGQTQTPN